MQDAAQDLAKFGKTVQLVGLAPFQGTQQALTEINSISEGLLTDYLKATLETNIPTGKKVTLGVSEKLLAGSIKSEFPKLVLETPETSEPVADLLRGLRQHGAKVDRLTMFSAYILLIMCSSSSNSARAISTGVFWVLAMPTPDPRSSSVFRRMTTISFKPLRR